MNITLRGCDEELAKALKATSKKLGLSVNRLVLDTLAKGILGKGKTKRRYNDLDHLAGTWSAEEASTFETAISDFGKVEASLWVAEKS